MAVNWSEAPKRGGVLIVCVALAAAFVLGLAAGRMTGTGENRTAEADAQQVAREEAERRARSPIGQDASSSATGGRGMARGSSTFVPGRRAQYAGQTVGQLFVDLAGRMGDRGIRLNMSEQIQEIVSRYQAGDLSAFTADAASSGLNSYQIQDLVHAFTSYHARTDPQGALAAALAVRDWNYRHAGILGVAEEWALTEPEAAFAWLQSASPEEQALGYAPILREMSQVDPQAAWQFALDTRNAAFWDGGSLAPLLVALEPESIGELRGYLAQLGRDDLQRPHVLRGVLANMAVRDPEGLLALAAAADDEGRGLAEGAVHLAYQQLAGRDLTAVREQLPQLSEELQMTLAPQIAARMTREEGLDAAMTFLDSLESDKVFNHAILRVADEASLNDPATAIELARQATSKQVRAILTDNAYSIWTGQDPAAAWAGAVAETDLQLRQWAMEAVLSAEVEIDPVNAFQKALASGDEEILKDMMVRSYPRIVDRNRSLAREIADQLPEGPQRERAEELLAK